MEIVISNKNGITLKTANKVCEEDIVLTLNDSLVPTGTLEITENGEYDVTNKASVNVQVPIPEYEEYDGTYEDITGLYSLTLTCDSNILNSNYYTYSLDSGSTWNRFTSETMALKEVAKIRFKASASGYCINVGTTNGAKDIAYVKQSTSDDIFLTTDSVWYLKRKIST